VAGWARWRSNQLLCCCVLLTTTATAVKHSTKGQACIGIPRTKNKTCASRAACCLPCPVPCVCCCVPAVAAYSHSCLSMLGADTRLHGNMASGRARECISHHCFRNASTATTHASRLVGMRGGRLCAITRPKCPRPRRLPPPPTPQRGACQNGACRAQWQHPSRGRMRTRQAS